MKWAEDEEECEMLEELPGNKVFTVDSVYFISERNSYKIICTKAK